VFAEKRALVIGVTLLYLLECAGFFTTNRFLKKIL